MSDAFAIVGVNSGNFTREDLLPFVRFRSAYDCTVFSDDPPKSEVDVIRSLCGALQDSSLEVNIFGVHLKQDPSRYVATFSYALFKKDSASYESNSHICLIDIKVLPGFRQKGLARYALQNIIEEISKYQQIKQIVGHTLESDGRSAARHIGGIEVQVSVENRLYLNRVDWSEVELWVKQGRANNAGSEIVSFDTIPEEILVSYAKTFQLVANRVPRGDVEYGRVGVTPGYMRQVEDKMKRLDKRKLAIATIEPNGDISGISELYYRPENTFYATQGITGVVDEYRGRGLGKLLKAYALLNVKRNIPSINYIKTDNATTNEPMLHINKALGFAKWREQADLQLNVSDVVNYLKK